MNGASQAGMTDHERLGLKYTGTVKRKNIYQMNQGVRPARPATTDSESSPAEDEQHTEIMLLRILWCIVPSN